MAKRTIEHRGSHRGGYLPAWVILGVAFTCLLLFWSCTGDHGLGPTVQGIRGTVRFSGAWPDTLLEVRVAVFEDYPVESFLDLSGYSDSIPLFCDSAAYEVRLAAGRYDFIAVACRRTASWDAGCLLGFYHLPATPDTPASIDLDAGVFLGGIDINVDFGTPLRSEPVGQDD